MMPVIRRGVPGDLDSIAAIQSRSPEAARWKPRDYLAYDFWVATADNTVAGFVVVRQVASGEGEILNLAVSPEFRRRGIATHLMQAVLKTLKGSFYLEVRESNEPARKFYKSLGFQELSVRLQYYESPLESAIVMNFHSC